MNKHQEQYLTVAIALCTIVFIATIIAFATLDLTEYQAVSAVAAASTCWIIAILATPKVCKIIYK